MYALARELIDGVERWTVRDVTVGPRRAILSVSDPVQVEGTSPPEVHHLLGVMQGAYTTPDRDQWIDLTLDPPAWRPLKCSRCGHWQDTHSLDPKFPTMQPQCWAHTGQGNWCGCTDPESLAAEPTVRDPLGR